MAETDKKEDPKLALARQRAASLAKAGPGRNPRQVGQFIKETWTELKKTTWPDRATLSKSTYIVLAFIALTAVWVGIIDFALGRIAAPLFGGQ